ncbi:lysophospholipid acyltransferase family protein [Plantactinospora sonchi]|uniref:Lysophospholipid acyltransferase family protein n=1 Tax=Plantactinospora sonchi TaxID=1544735 RepID=A0ABU7RKX6_9ACTN
MTLTAAPSNPTAARVGVSTAPAAVPVPVGERAGSLWRPQSNCGQGCLPGPGQTPRVSGSRQVGRMAALLGVLLLGAALVPVLPVLSRSARQAAGRRWARAVLAAFGVTLLVRGEPPRQRALLVANHVSWLDVVAVLAVAPARMLAKHEVRRWPLIGPLAARGGTLFVDRTRPRALPGTVARVARALRSGAVVAVFPEGTTWCGVPRPAVGCGWSGRFRPAMFQAAVDARVPVVPVRLSYRAGSAGATAAPAFLAEETLLDSVRRVLSLRELVVTVTVTAELSVEPPADPRSVTVAARRRLAEAAEVAVRAAAGAVAGQPDTAPGVPVVPSPARAADPRRPVAAGARQVGGRGARGTAPRHHDRRRHPVRHRPADR